MSHMQFVHILYVLYVYPSSGDTSRTSGESSRDILSGIARVSVG
jgi:hypothetical protein